MKKFVSLLLVLCVVAALLPMSALAAETAVPKIRCFNGPNKSNFYVNPSATPSYIISKDDKTFVKWTEAEAPTDKYVKFELIAGTPNVVKATFKNFDIDNVAAGGYTNHSIVFQAADYDVEIVLEDNNSMIHGNSASIQCVNNGNVSITGSGSLYLEQKDQAAAALWVSGGDLLIKNTTLSLKVYPEGSPNSKHQAIMTTKGNVTIEGCKITSDTMGGSLVWLGPNADKPSQSITTDETRIITVKDSELEIKVHNGSAFSSAAPAVISNTTMKVSKTTSSGSAIFTPSPTFEGEHTVIAGLIKNAENLSKLKEYQASKVGQYTYVYLVPGVQNLIPETTTEPTEPPAVTQPEESKPAEITPEESTPAETTSKENNPVENKPAETTPATTAPAETTPATTAPADNSTNDGGNSGSPIAAIMITVLVMVALAGAAVATLIILKKKGIIK